MHSTLHLCAGKLSFADIWHSFCYFFLLPKLETYLDYLRFCFCEKKMNDVSLYFSKVSVTASIVVSAEKLCYRRWNCKSSIFEKTCTEALARWWSVKNVFLTPAACNFIKKETPLQVFSCKFRYIFSKHHFL